MNELTRHTASGANAPAFPCEIVHSDSSGQPCSGLTKREYFAAMAMQGILSGPCSRDGVPAREWLDVPVEAVKIADKLLALLSDDLESLGNKP